MGLRKSYFCADKDKTLLQALLDMPTLLEVVVCFLNSRPCALHQVFSNQCFPFPCRCWFAPREATHALRLTPS